MEEVDKLLPTPTSEYTPGAERVASTVRKEVRMQDKERGLLQQTAPNPFAQERANLGSGIIGTDFSDYRREDMMGEYKDGTQVARYDIFYQGIDNEEKRAQEQSTTEKWKHGLGKLAGKFGTGFAGNLVGSFYGLGEALATGRSEAIYDNSFMDFLDDLNVGMDYKLPNWYSEKEKNLSAIESMGTANFWANDVTSGATFTLSTIASELALGYLSGGTSLTTTGARVGASAVRQFSKAGKLARATAKKASTLNVDQAFLKEASLSGMREGARLGAKAGELAKSARYMYTSSMYESGFETRMFRNESRENFDRAFVEMNDRMPTIEEREEYEKYLDEASQFTFLANMAFVGTSNLVGPMRTLTGFNGSGTAKAITNRSIFGAGVEKTKEGTFKALSPTKSQKALRKGYNVFSGMINEGAQEGLQGATTNASNLWISDKFNPETNKAMYDLLDAFKDGVGETLTTKEGHKEMLIGALIGMFSGVAGAYKQSGSLEGGFKSQDERSKALEKFSESNLGKNFTDIILYGQRTIRNSENFDEAVNKGDKIASELYRKEASVNQFTFAYNQDYFNETVEQGVNSMRLVPVEEIAEAYDLEIEEAETFKQDRIQEYINLSKEYKKNRRFADEYIASNLTDEEQEVFKGNTGRLKELIAYTLTMGKDSYNTTKENFNNIITAVSEIYGDNSGDALQAMEVIGSAKESAQKELTALQDSLRDNRAELNKLEAERNKLTRSIVSQDAEVARTQRLNQIAFDIEENTRRKEELEREFNTVLKLADASNPFTEGGTQLDYITSEALEETEKALEDLRGFVTGGGAISESKQMQLASLMDAYQKNLEIFRSFAETAEKFSSSDLQLTGKGSFAKRWLKGNKINNTTLDFLKGMQELNESGVITDEATSQAIFDSGIVDEVLNNSAKKPLKIVPKVRTEADKRKEGLREKINQLVEKSPYYRSKGIDGDTITTDERMVLADEILQDTTLTDGGVSLKDLVDQFNQLVEETEVTPIEEGMNEEGFQNIVQDTPFSYFNESNVQVSVRDAEIAQVYENAFVKTGDETVTIHNITPQGFVESLGAGGVEIEFNDGRVPQVVPTSELNEHRGSITSFSLVGMPITITLDPYSGTMSMNKESFRDLMGNDSNGLEVYDNAISRTNRYLLLYKDGRPMSTDFNKGDVVQTPQEIYKMKKGSKVYFQVNTSDPYNVSAIAEYKALKGKKAKQEGRIILENKLKVDIVDSSGAVVGTLKSNNNTQNAKENFLLLRKMATDSAIKAPRGATVSLGASSEVKHVFLGLPNLNIVNGEVQTKPVNPEHVIDYGYWNGKELILKEGTSEVRDELPRKIGKKSMPVVVLRHHGQLIAMPVGLVPTVTDIRPEIEQEFLSGGNIARSVVAFNQRLINAGLNPKQYNLYFYSEVDNTVIEEGEFSPSMEKAIEDLQERENLSDFKKEWMSKNFTKEDLADSAVIGVDEAGDFMVSPRPVIDFDILDTVGDNEVIKKNNKETRIISKKVEQVIEERKAEIQEEQVEGVKISEDREVFEKVKELPLEERVNKLVEEGIVKPFTYESKGKDIIVVDINGVSVPFLKHTKVDGFENTWQPFFGFGDAGNLEWILTGNSTDKKDGYNSEWLQEYSKMLNDTLPWKGKNTANLGNLKPVATEEEFNREVYGEGFTKLENGAQKLAPYILEKVKEVNRGRLASRLKPTEVTLNESEQTELDTLLPMSELKQWEAKTIIEKDC